MHSRIFQISKKPILPEEYANVSTILDNNVDFVGNVADYVIVADDPVYDIINWLFRRPGISGKEEAPGIYYFTINKHIYFKDKYEDFCNILKDISDNMDFEMFCNNSVTYKLYCLTETHDEQTGLWIADHDLYEDMITLDSFVRNTDEGCKYYIGSVFDYHY